MHPLLSGAGMRRLIFSPGRAHHEWRRKTKFTPTLPQGAQAYALYVAYRLCTCGKVRKTSYFPAVASGDCWTAG